MSPSLRVAAVVACCLAPLGAQRALLERLPPDADVAQHAHVGFGAEWEPWRVPGDGQVFALTRLADRLWILRGTRLHCLEWPTRRELRSVDAPADLVGLAADERFLYGIAGRQLHVLDPVAGTSMRTVPIAAVWPPSTIAVHRGALHVAVDFTVMTLDAASGAVQPVHKLGGAPHWLASDGERLWYGTAAECRPLAGEPAAAGAWPGREWPSPLVESAACWVDGRLLVAYEQRDDRNRRQVFAGLLTPVPDIPAARIEVTIYATSAVSVDEGKAYWQLPSGMFEDEAAVLAELRALANAPSSSVPGPDGKPTRKPVVIVALPGVKIRDVLKTWDLALAAGFTSVHCPRQETWVRQQEQAKPTDKEDK